MYNGPAQQFPPPPAVPPSPPPGGGTGRTVAVTSAVTIASYAVLAAIVGAVVVPGAGSAAAGPEFDGLPTQPCAAATGAQLGALSAFLPSASFSEARSSCGWRAEFSDGTSGSLSIAYRFPTDRDGEPLRRESEVEEHYEEMAEELLEGSDSGYWSVEVQESRELDIGDRAVVSHYREGSDDVQSNVEVLVLTGGLLVEVSAHEPWEGRSGRADFTGDEETLIAIAEHAVAQLD